MSSRSSLQADVQLVQNRVHGQPRLLASGADQQAGKRHQPRESLRADHRLRAPVCGAGPAVALRHRARLPDLGARDRLRDRELACVPLPQQLQPLGRLPGQVLRLEQLRVLPPAEYPGDRAGGVRRTRSRRSRRGPARRPACSPCAARRRRRSRAPRARRSAREGTPAPCRRSRPSASRRATRSHADRSPRAARSRAPPWSRRRPCPGSARGGRPARPRARANGRSSRTGRCGRPGGRGPPCDRRPGRAASSSS